MKTPYLAGTILLAAFSFMACRHTKKVTVENGLKMVMYVESPVRVGTPLMLKFTVRNESSKELKFCKWHTPFEGFRAAFLDIKSDYGNVNYRGIMAKRVMPPPADAYISVPAGDSVSVTIDLLKGYEITLPGNYSVVYQAGGVSGLQASNEAVFRVTE